MEAQEFDNALTDLETRVDRLRALYENWFRGYEKTEPSVPRKDVERRVYGLRKELPRNTALRFRYHQLYQRFTTLANYWQRTAKQVEEGTYRLQLQRMRRKKDEVNARTLPPRSDDEAETIAPKSYELTLDESLNVSQLLDDFELDELATAIEAPGKHEPVTAPVRPSVSTRFARPSADAAASPRGSLTLESLERLGGVAGMAGAANDTTPANAGEGGGTMRAPARQPSLEESARRSVETMSPAVLLGQPRVDLAAGMSPTSAMERPSQPTATRGLPSAGASRVDPGAAPPQGARTAQPQRPGGSPARPALPDRAGLEGRPNSEQPARTGAASAALGGSPAAPQPPATPMRSFAAPPPPSSTMARPSAGSSDARPPPPPRVPPPPPPRPSAAAPGGGAINEQHIRRIYDEYVAARRKNNEGDVRYETLASSIQKMLPDLQKRHQGKRIDFEVVLKDGRVGLKPKAI